MLDLVFFDAGRKEGFISVNPITAKSPKELKKKLEACREGIMVVIGENEKIVSEASSSKKVDIILNPVSGREKDPMHYRSSGLSVESLSNAKKNGIAIGFSFDGLKGVDASRTLGHMMQDVSICRKYRLDFVLASFAYFDKDVKSQFELGALGNVIGMRSDEIKDALGAVERIIRKKGLSKEKSAGA